MKIYIKATGNAGQEVNYIKVEFYYSKGGMNYMTYKNEKRGYYISVTPVKREDRGSYCMESYVGFSGFKDCLLEVTRQSKKAEETAREIFYQEKSRYINYLIERHGLTLEA